MSEETNSSHICTTEDAFEKFQAVSMYEEDDYITLSDLLPSQAQTPELMNEICDVPYENEVVLESALEEQVHEVNSTIESRVDENKMSGCSDDQFISTSGIIDAGQYENIEAGHIEVPEAGHIDVPEAGPSEVIEETVKTRKSGRPRKKKKFGSNYTSDTELNNSIKDSMVTKEQCGELVKTPGQRRRGRPPKTVSQNIDIDATTPPHNEVSKGNKSSSNGASPLKEDFQNDSLIYCKQQTTVKKRGRPRKNNTDQQMLDVSLSSDTDLQDVNNSNEIVMNASEIDQSANVPLKRLKRMRLLSSEKSDGNLSESDKKNTSNISDNHPNKKCSSKRGRPKKKQLEDKVLTLEQPKVNNNQDLEIEKGDNLPNNDDDDETDDICLSKLKTSIDSQDLIHLNEGKETEKHEASTENLIELEESEKNMPHADLSTVHIETNDVNTITISTESEMIDFEHTIDNIVSVNNEKPKSEKETVNDSDPFNLLVEDTSKRPTRRRARKPLQYDEESDEDPFANVELSDDEPIGCKKKYYSDEEYIPGKNKKGKQSESSDSDSDIDLDNIEEELLENKRKRTFNKSEGSPNKGAKRGRKIVHEKRSEGLPTDVACEGGLSKPESKMDDDIEVCLMPSVIKTTDNKKNKELESFLAKKIQGTDIQIKKVSTVQPLEIPVIDPNEPKKMTESSTQTKEVSLSTAGVQTVATYDIPIKENVKLTAEQSEKACEFLKSIVKTTADLGDLMTQKSQDFMKKKINVENVTDTLKMDYCVRKSFLLFKLAKHNLIQMEEDLAQQYDAFLNTHNLQQYREQPKVLTAAPKTGDSDSDCEIVETPIIQKTPKKKEPAAFNPKTVFLNKELSIKIAKKTPDKKNKPEEKKINIKGRHTVWINDSVMVKKVKPTQSFLAQDSRNKKPPDYVTIEMVNDFFKQYYRQKALAACAPYVSTDWLANTKSVCCYFFANADGLSVNNDLPSGSGQCAVPESNSSTSNVILANNLINREMSPKTLFSLCTRVLQVNLYNSMKCLGKMNDLRIVAPKLEYNPNTLYGLCVNTIIILCQNSTTEDMNCVSASTSPYHEVDQEDKDSVSASPLLEQQAYRDTDSTSLPASLCQDYAEDDYESSLTLLHHEEHNDNIKYKTTSTLKTLCHKKIVSLIFDTDQSKLEFSERDFICDELNMANIDEFQRCLSSKKLESSLKIHENYVKSLFTLCYDLICSHMTFGKVDKKCIKYKHNVKKRKQTPKTLKFLTFKCVTDPINKKRVCPNVSSMDLPNQVKTLSNLCFQIVTKSISNSKDTTLHEGLTINSINTLTEEAYHNIQHAELTENLSYFEDYNSNFYDDEIESGLDNLEGNNVTVDSNWLSHVQMKELRSCYTPNIPPETETEPFVSIKIEPIDEFQENIDLPAIVKTEPLSQHPDEMTIIPENIVAKTEYVDTPAITHAPIQRQNSSSYDVDTFEAFMATNKMMHNIDEYSNDDEEIFSQSTLRVRRQFEPDDLSESDMGMSLLVPQTFEPLCIENNAKNRLMESSSDEGSNSKKVPGKKKIEKRLRGKPRRNDNKSGNNKGPGIVPTKEKTQTTNEIAILTRRMREKIRQEEKKVVTSESDNESESIISKKCKLKEDKCKSSKVAEDLKQNQTAVDVQKTKPADKEIQCSNVDSTEQIGEGRIASPSVDNFTGFTAVDQNEMSSYQKYVKYVYDQILPKVTEETQSSLKESGEQSTINYEEPVELLECEPAMDFFSETPRNVIRKPGPKTKTQNIQDIKNVLPRNITEDKTAEDNKENNIFIERHGWKCYPLDSNDTKLYQNAQILLEKLPESFVQTYFTYQDIAAKTNEDEEVNRLINLQTLNRLAIKEGKGYKSKHKSKILQKSSELLGSENNHDRISASPTFSENLDELTPSEDEGAKVEDEIPSPISKPTSDNNLAKNSLMDDHDSDSGMPKVKEEPLDYDQNLIKTKPKINKSHTKIGEQVPLDPVMLTADKMMNKELNLLHAPVNLNETIEPTPSKGRATKKQKSVNKTSPKDHVKAEDDSSSEEEKHQWFTIKEKLLKRMVKKNDTTREDDAKRAKLVSEFIERRGDSSDAYIKRRGCRGRRVSKKTMLERQKQLKVLTRELFGDPSNDASLLPKRSQQALYKGRRNIRKVIDKKSLARSTVVANMEEFERKRRINTRQSKLREIMQCEDGVNVLVINDEVCLEYDFEAHRPVVTIHPFFTRVMKAHQYEGVKFMWDACFESLESIAAGSPGGGCILAHCMGLGKTLQVLALLHTVLTHPRVGMQRVLVCCPLSTVLNWVDEIHKWIGPVTSQIKVFELSKLRKTSNRAYQLEDWYTGGGIFIIGYELFRSLTTLDPFLDDVRPAVVKKIRTALLDPGPDIIICDEGHLLKNDCSVLAVAMSRVVTRRRIVLTGTPMQNNLREYYCMVNFVKPNLLGTYPEYSNRFENPIMNGQHRDSQEEDIKLMKARTHILHKVLEGCLQRQEASVLYAYLPKKHEYTVFISLTKCQWDLYKHYLQNYGHTANNKSILKDFHILQKIWSHPQVLHNFQNRSEETRNKIKQEKLEDDLAREDLDATEDIKPADTEVWWLQYLEGGAMLDSLASSNKFVAIFRILEESIAVQDKVLIFSTSLYTLDALEYFLKKINNWSLGQEYFRLDGSVPAEVRQKWCREFNAENNIKTKLFLISTRAGCLGLNMTAANRVIILDTSWNPAHDIQSIFRVYRFGQKKDCFIYRLVALGTMEQKIYERSVTKQAVACRVVDEQQIDRHYNMADLTELYKYDETGSGVAGGVAVGVEDVVLLRVARDAALHAVHEHDSLLRGSLEQNLPEHERDAAWVQFQEEHAHKQQMQEMPPPVKIKKVKVKVPTQAPADLTSNINLGVVKTENEEIILPNDPDFTPVSTKSKSKSRKGRNVKSTVVSCCIPIQPEVTEAEGSSLDDDMVKKITHILIKHNYQNNQGPREIAELVSRVRSLVYSGNMDQLDSSNELTMSIARVLLGKDAEAALPPLTDISLDKITDEPSTSASNQMNEETPSTAAKSRRKSRRGHVAEEKTKKGYVYEEVPSTSAQPAGPEGRKRRRAALAAEKSFEALPPADPVDDLHDDDSLDNEFLPEAPIQFDEPPRAASDTDSAEEVFPNIQVKSEILDNSYENASKPPKSKLNKNDSVSVEDRKKTDKLQPNHLDEQSSIVLSDDEDYLPPAYVIRKKPGRGRKTIKTEDVESQAAGSSSSSKNDNVVSLHPTLLSNKNFIKIVAHTYLSGNPMLDEDAATLAAQYSTFKALKEFEASGKNIDSGPIYDIAKKVLGVDVLKKLHNSNIKFSTSEMVAQHPINSQDSAPAKETVVNSAIKQAQHVTDKKVIPESTPIKKSKPGPASKKTTAVAQDSETVLPSVQKYTIRQPAQTQSQPVPSPVTPIETSAPEKKPITIRLKLPKSSLVPKSIYPSVPASATPANVVPVGLFKGAADVPASESLFADECILPDDDDDIRIVTEPAPARRALSYPLTAVYAAAAPPAPAAAVPAPPAPDLNTISLDSDDDEPAAPPPVPRGPAYAAGDRNPPVPISLTAVHPSSVPAHVRPTFGHKFRKILPQPAGTSIILQSANAQAGGLSEMLPGGGKYILVPASSLTRTPPVLPVAGDEILASATQPNLTTAPPDPSNLTQFVPQEVNPAISTDVGAVRAVETTLPNTQQNIDLTKGSKRICKPGDILRITKGGSIEVLNRKDAPKTRSVAESKPPSPPATPVHTRMSSGSATSSSIVSIVIEPTNSEITQNADQKSHSRNFVSTDLKTPATSTTDRKASKTSATSFTKEPSNTVNIISSRSPSPSDIFKNVIHIEADDYDCAIRSTSDSTDASTSAKKSNRSTINSDSITNEPSGVSNTTSSERDIVSNTTKTLLSTSKTSILNTKTSATNTKGSATYTKTSANNTKASATNTKASATSTKASAMNTKVSVTKAKPSGSEAKATGTYTKVSVTKVKPSEPEAKAAASTSKPHRSSLLARNAPVSGKVTTAQNKAKELIVDSVDLTDIDYLPPVSLSSSKKSKPTTIVGTSKSIILCASGKAVAKPGASTKTTTTTPAKPSPKADQVATAFKTEVTKKRPATVDNSSVKKKKTDKPMTLKDFDIDDIDDIIELD